MTILGIGTTVVDHCLVLQNFPDEDTKIEFQHSWTQVGGPVPVALSVAAALGSPTRLLSRWAADDSGRLIQSVLKSRGIDLSFIEAHKHWRTGQAQVWINETAGTRTIAFHRGQFPTLTETDISESLIADCQLLHLDGWSSPAALAAAHKVKEQGGVVVLDAGSVKPGLHRLLPFVDVLIASRLFLKQFRSNWEDSVQSRSEHIHQHKPEQAFANDTDDHSTCLRLQQLTTGTIIATNGSEAVHVYSRGDRQEFYPPSISAVDSNGAGDSFSGAIIHAISEGWPLNQTIPFAIDVASSSCQTYGNQPDVSALKTLRAKAALP